jgi:probable phosphoglycerate mutase
VLERSIAVVEQIRREPGLGQHVVIVAHADVVKLIVAHYFGIDVDQIHFLHTENGSVTSLAFRHDDHPTLLALDWTPAPSWLGPMPATPEPDRDTANATASTETAPPTTSETA